MPEDILDIFFHPIVLVNINILWKWNKINCVWPLFVVCPIYSNYIVIKQQTTNSFSMFKWRKKKSFDVFSYLVGVFAWFQHICQPNTHTHKQPMACCCCCWIPFFVPSSTRDNQPWTWWRWNWNFLLFWVFFANFQFFLNFGFFYGANHVTL